MSKNPVTSFDGDLSDESTIRAKLAEVEKEIAEQGRLRDEVEEELTRLERLKQALLVLPGEKHAESDAARTARLATEQARHERLSEQLLAAQELRQSAASIQAQVIRQVDFLSAVLGNLESARTVDEIVSSRGGVSHEVVPTVR